VRGRGGDRQKSPIVQVRPFVRTMPAVFAAGSGAQACRWSSAPRRKTLGGIGNEKFATPAAPLLDDDAGAPDDAGP
jgi:hypothetical protein